MLLTGVKRLRWGTMLCALLPVMAQIDLPKTWYGPVTATFEVQYPGNPYDEAENDVRIRFTDSKGLVTERLAFYDNGAFKAIFVSDHPETYKAQLVRNGQVQPIQATDDVFSITKPLAHGYIERDPKAVNRFRYSDGSPYVPLGCNLGWGSAEQTIPDTLRKMGGAQATWTRIWACNWDGKNPWWSAEKASALPGQLWPDALDQWQTIVDTADEVSVPFQMVLFHHGAFSSTTNPNWPDHPWNAAKGGFLKSAADFFTDVEAKRRTKMWLRYAVARYGASPNILAWELFNEVEWVDAYKQKKWKEISDWNKEMADYIRSIDPYHHLITTSSEMEQDIYGAMDYYQPHTYPPSITASVFGKKFPPEKSGFFGEYGPMDSDHSFARKALRDGLYAGLLANHAGAAMYWYWDVLDRENLYGEYTHASQIVATSKWWSHPAAKPLILDVDCPRDQPLSFAPGLGWAKTSRSTFELPKDANPLALSEVAGYFQGKNNASLSAGPMVFRFTAPNAGEMKISIAEVATLGAKLVVTVNGGSPVTYDYSEGSGKKKDLIVIPFAKGTNEVRVANEGQDWVRISRIDVPGIGPTVTGIGLQETGWLLARLTAAREGETVKVAAPRVTGVVKVTLWDLHTGNVTKTEASADALTMKVAVTLPGKDNVVLIEK